jgi:hypothetical protein
VKKSSSSDAKSLIILIAGVAALITLLTWWGGWALPVVIIAIFVMVMGHEFGHFITAKRAGMQVTDFFVGFGPGVSPGRLREGSGHDLGRGDSR